MKKFINGFKILWNDERGRALIKLGAYILFIVFAIVYARTVNSAMIEAEGNRKTALELFTEKKSYLADIKYDGVDVSLIGGDIISFEYNGDPYTVVNSQLLKNGENNSDFEIYFWEITPKLIGKLVDEREADYISNFKDGTIKSGYNITLYDFIKEFNGSVLNVSDIENIPEDTITIVLEENDSKITKVILELDSYYKLVKNENKKFRIELKY